MREALNSMQSIVPQMTTTPKDHKPLPDSGVPKSRPLCNASQTINGRLSEAVSDTLSDMLAADGDSAEVVSTEDLLSKVEDFNNLIREGQVEGDKLVLGSLDVEALYPSIDIKLARQKSGIES